jgi:hypothetical protein
MLQWDAISDLFSNPVVIRYLIGGVILIAVLIICCIVHNKLKKL